MTPRRALAKKSVHTIAIIATAAAILAAAAMPAIAQDISINLTEGTGVTERAIQIIALITILSLAPSILVMVTSFSCGRDVRGVHLLVRPRN